jgi:drug/metabolite transporter (DMT)-like permease
MKQENRPLSTTSEGARQRRPGHGGRCRSPVTIDSMHAPKPAAKPKAFDLVNQPYLLLSLTALFWASNIIVGRHVVGQIPPVVLALIRWSGGFLLILPLAWPHLKRDRPIIRRHLGILLLLSVTGIAAFNTMAYWALEYTQALNGLLLQSSTPLFVAVWSLLLLGVRLTLAQALGVLVSTAGVAIILLRGDPAALAAIEFNRGDVIFVIAFAIFGFYTTLTVKSPPIHPFSFLAVTFGCGGAFLIPFAIWEAASGHIMTVTTGSVLSAAYIVVFPATLAYLCYNRGIQLIGANRAAPFSHLIPVFGSIMAIGLLGEEMRLFHLIGYALVLSGVIVAARTPRNSRAARQ